MIEVAFANCDEIRMGSPWRRCDVEIRGEWSPDLPATDWLEVFATSTSREQVALVRWDIRDNEPGFRVVTVDANDRTVTESPRIEGICAELTWDEDGPHWRTA